MSMWTDLECFRATVEHRRPGRILYYAWCVPDLRRRVAEGIGTDDIAGHYGMFSPVGIAIRRPEGASPPDYSAYWRDEDLPEGTAINEVGVALKPSGFYHFEGYVSPLRNAASLAAIENYPLEDQRAWTGSHMAQEVRQAHADGRVVNSWVGHMYETAWQIRGYEPFLMDMVERPSWAECLLDRLAEQNMIRAVAATRAGVDWLHCGDDVANQKALMFSPDLWRSMMLSRWRKVWQTCKAINPQIKVWYHSDGNVSAIVPELIEAGVDILNPLQPECVNLDDLHRRFGRRLTFDGTIGTQTTMPFGSADDVRTRVREVIDKYGREGGLIVSPTHVLEPEVPLDNIDAFFQTCREYGRLDA